MNNESDYKDNLYFERTNKMQKIFDTDNEKEKQKYGYYEKVENEE